MLSEAKGHLKKVREFKAGGTEAVKKSMSKPTDLALLEAAFVAIIPNALITRDFKEFSARLGKWCWILLSFRIG
jgi:hypothetical protein